MSIYLAAQVAVYQHLLARHAQDDTFRFSMRSAFSAVPTANEGLFKGTAKSGYFAFTLWHIPLAFPGAAMDLLAYIVQVLPTGTFGVRLQILLPREGPEDRNPSWHPNTLLSRGLLAELQRTPWPAEVAWQVAPPANKMLQAAYQAAKSLPDIPALLVALDAALNATIPGIDAAVEAYATYQPGWVGRRYTAAQFEKLRSKAEDCCAGLLNGEFPTADKRSYWCAQVETDPARWHQLRKQGIVRPLFNQLLAGPATGSGDGSKLLPQAKPGDVVIITRGPRRVLGVGMLTGQFAPDHEQPPYYCPVDWLLTTPIELPGTGTPFVTGSMVWNRTKQWPKIREQYVKFEPKRISKLDAGFDLADVAGTEAETSASEEVAAESNPPPMVEPTPLPAPTTPAYWWLNINPTFWKVADFAVNQEQTWTTHNEKGHKRVVYQHFKKVKPGDLVIGYETTPTKRVKVLLEITEPAHANEEEEEIITLRVKEFVREELTREQLLAMPELAQCEALAGGMGSLFKLMPTEFAAIIARAQRVVAPPLPPYSLAQAEQDLFLPTDQILHLQAALRRKKNLIVQGPPGVGKTYVARRLAWLQMGEQDPGRVQLVQFHQSYSYEDFIRGWRPTEKGGFELANGVFVDFVRRAQHDPDRDYFFLIDEINRGNLSKIFGELLLLLEADKRSPAYALPLTYRKDGEAPFYLPLNLYVIGTMNTADRSLALVDYALRRRFTFVDLLPMLGDKLRQQLIASEIPEELAAEVLTRVAALNLTIKEDKNLGSGFLIGHSYFCTPLAGETPAAWWDAIVRHDLAPLLREYWFDSEAKASKAIAALHGPV